MVLLSGCDWTMFGYDAAHTRASSDTSISTATVEGLVAKWTQTGGSGVEDVSSPAESTLKSCSGTGCVYTPVVYEGHFIQSAGGALTGSVSAVNAKTGAPLWTTATKTSTRSSPAVANGLVYIGDDDGIVYAFNAATGAQQWIAYAAAPMASSPAVVNGVVYVGDEEGNLYAFNASTGATLWSALTRLGAEVDSSPAVVNGVVYIGNSYGDLDAFNASTGAAIWSKNLDGTEIWSSPAETTVTYCAPTACFHTPVIYVATDGNPVTNAAGSAYAVDADTGAIVWKASLGASVGNRSSPAVANGIVYVGATDGTVHAFNANSGAVVWTASTTGPVESSPAVANGIVYVGSDDGYIRAYDASTGAELWAAPMSGGGVSSPAVANGFVYIGSDGGTLYAYGLP
jgi:outer membrane protein assembly factor BamB